MKRAMLAAIGLLSLSVFVLAAAAAGSTTRYVSPSGVDNPTCSKHSPCKHIQQAVNVASAGDTISLATGNYVEQVTIAKDLTLTGAGSGASTISAPAVVLVPDGHGFLNIVEINSGASVRMSHLAVAGPALDPATASTGGSPSSRRRRSRSRRRRSATSATTRRATTATTASASVPAPNVTAK